ncbi:LOW QUALITY PROTEIN: uncharacterized protein ColSpa_05335 [Colletotrichum spaethianum]|uniref:Uncharacterized protein n=1 Tax=Colletotrichum spaethianum TaxID=700344 RepID=A0AA37P7Q6_9PEZI|nr:LOW QUALITY PROTEIN: uncharacterized protein ColSpa_05335 [Colletotrichum spaethianum]GKT45154.1 LOW QUALITY PROTEIN: hypothetical protein ColSpa_05335 [Colletotrichum spaethianum]
MSLAAPGGSIFGNIGMHTDASGGRWLRLPTGNANNRALLLALAINDEERLIINMPSRDIEIRVTSNTSVQQFVASIIRRQGYFLAVLVQSRGRWRLRRQSHGARCTHRGRDVDSSDNPGDDDDDDDNGGPSNYKAPNVTNAREPRTPGSKLGKNIGKGGRFLGTSASPMVIDKE